MKLYNVQTEGGALYSEQFCVLNIRQLRFMNYTGKTYALLVAAGDYHEQNMENLPCSSKDLEIISDALQRGLKVEQDHIRILGQDGYVSALSFARAIAEFRSLLSEEDTFLFYFSGHGRQKELMFSDGAVTIESIVDYIDRLQALSKVVLLDCCYSGSAQVSSVMDMTFEESIAAFAGKGIAVMASSASGSRSWLSGSGRSSLYTLVVSSAILSRRGIREGKLSLSDINLEIRYLMGQWNRFHPDCQQHPIFRNNMVGTVFFHVEEYHPYVTQKITLETADYILQSVKPLSSGQQKRLAAFVITKKEDDSALPAITREIAQQIKNSDVYSSQKSEQRFRGKTADAIWCYFGHDETDLARSNHYAYSIWAQKPQMRKLYYRENRNAEIVDGIYIFWNTSYGMVKELQKTDTPEEKIIADYRKLENLLIQKAEEFRSSLNEVENGTCSFEDVQKEFYSWIRDVRSLYYKLTDIPPAPVASSRWSEAVLELAGWIVDLAMLLENQKTWESGGDRWMILETYRRYEKSLEELSIMENQSFIPD